MLKKNNYESNGLFRKDNKFLNLLDKVRTSSREFALPVGADLTKVKQIEAQGWISAAANRLSIGQDDSLADAFDATTGLSSAPAFGHQLRYELLRARRYKCPLSLCLIQIDKLSELLNEHGVFIRESIIGAVAERIQGTVREVDLPARYSEELLAVILPQTDSAGASAAAERICKVVQARNFVCAATMVNVSVSIGIYTVDESTRTSESLIEKARQSLELARERGGNQVAKYTGD